MKKIQLFLIAAIILLSSPTAFASNPSGLLTLVVGIPLLVVASAVLTIMLFMRPNRSVKVVSIVLFVPLLSYSLYIAIDALTLFGTFGSENSMIGIAFFGLLGVVFFLFYVVINRSIKN